MLNIVRNGLLGLALLATVGGTAAMASTGGHQCAVHQRHGMMQQLNLTADQQSQIKGFMTQFRAERRADRQAFMGQLKLVLNQQQMARLTAHQQAMRNRWQANGRHAMSHRRGHRALAYLGLSPEQQAQVQAYRQASMPQMRAQRQQLTAQIRSVLTTDQQSAFDQLRAQHQGNRFGRQG